MNLVRVEAVKNISFVVANRISPFAQEDYGYKKRDSPFELSLKRRTTMTMSLSSKASFNAVIKRGSYLLN